MNIPEHQKTLSFRMLGAMMATPPQWQCLCYYEKCRNYKGDPVCPTLLKILAVLDKHEDAEAIK